MGRAKRSERERRAGGGERAARVGGGSAAPAATHRLAVALVPVLALGALAAGCRVPGAEAIRSERSSFNREVQRTNDEQLLLNVVRLRYRDTPYFLELSSISSSLEREATTSAAPGFTEGAPSTLGLTGTLRVSNNPTISYTPLQGEDFVRQLLTPVQLDTLVMLANSGWAVDRVLRLAAQRVDGFPNAPSASGPTPSRRPRYAEFLEAARLLRELQVRDELQLGRVERADGGEATTGAGAQAAGDEVAGGGVLELRFLASAEGSAEVERLRELLRLDPRRSDYALQEGISRGTGDAISVQTRSLMGILFYASQAVRAPRADEEAGRVTVTLDGTGERFDWAELFGGLLRIEAGPERPDDAYVAVRYRGSWFWIADDDLASKSTFTLLNQIFALRAGEIERNAPVLTIPVGG